MRRSLSETFQSFTRWLAVALTVAFCVSFVTSPVVFAQYDPCEVFGNCLSGTENFAGDNSATIANNIILQISYFLIFIGAAISVLYMVIGGYRMVASNGNESAVKEGRATFTNAAIGLILMIISLTVVTLISQIIPNLNIFEGSASGTGIEQNNVNDENLNSDLSNLPSLDEVENTQIPKQDPCEPTYDTPRPGGRIRPSDPTDCEPPEGPIGNQ